MPPSSIVQSSTLQLRQSIAGGRSRVSKEGRDPIELVGELIVVELRRKWIQRRSSCTFYTHCGYVIEYMLAIIIAEEITCLHDSGYFWCSRHQITFPAEGM